MPVSQSSVRTRKPVTTQIGIDLGTLMGGAIVTEVVFGLPGLDREVV